MNRAAIHYEAADLTLFAMQLLAGEEHRNIAAHVAGCAFCRQELARLQGDLAAYAHTLEMRSPASVVRERVLRQVAREKKPVAILPVEPITPIEPNSRIESPRRIEKIAPPEPALPAEEPEARFSTSGRSSRQHSSSSHPGNTPAPRSAGSILGKIFLGFGWGTTAALVFAGVHFYPQIQSDRARLSLQAGELDRLREDSAASRRLLDVMTNSSARHVLLSSSSSTADSAPEGRIIYVPESGSLVFLGENLNPLESSRTYELWLIPADGRDPISAGTFRPDAKGNASIILPPLPRATAAKAFGVTLEDEGGSQSPTLPIVLAGS